MPTPPASYSRPDDVLEAACAEALAAARWDEADLATRWPGDEAGALLLAKAAECALSAAARDQLLSVAIERVVGRADRDGPLFDGTPDPGERTAIAKQTFGLGPHKASETDALVALVESRHASDLCGRTASDRLAACLREEAVLHELLWDHPGIPADPHTRLAMLCAIPRLRDRADQLTTVKSSWFGGLKRLLRPARTGRPQ